MLVKVTVQQRFKTLTGTLNLILYLPPPSLLAGWPFFFEEADFPRQIFLKNALYTVQRQRTGDVVFPLSNFN